MTRKLITLGADPEVLVAKKSGKMTHVIGLVGGTKDEPTWVERDGKRIGAVQEDNVLYEFNIMPHDTREGFINNIQQMLEVGREILGEGFILTDKSSHIFEEDEMKTFPEQAFVFGCEPDFFAGTGLSNPKPQAPWPGLRTAGGHVHFGFDERVVIGNDNIQTLMRVCDYVMAIPSMLIDTDDRRRELYGKAGAYRPKAYGAEYRTLSNFWIHSRENTGFVFDQAQLAYNLVASGEFAELEARIPYDFVVDCINTNNRSMAEQMVKALKVA